MKLSEIKLFEKIELWVAAVFAAAIIVALVAGAFIEKKILTPTIPYSLILPVPFSTQAPDDSWTGNEDCEETSVTMANAYLTGTTEDKLPPDAAQNAIDNLKTWEQANLGYNANTGADSTSRMAEGAFGLRVEQVPNFTEAELKQAIVNHTPILLPVNAQKLGNAQYIHDGPLYHMIVIRGFKGDIFIVNDPGITGGDGNSYPFSVLQAASANWDEATQSIVSTQKIALVLSK
jgi:hypothetical protein